MIYAARGFLWWMKNASPFRLWSIFFKHFGSHYRSRVLGAGWGGCYCRIIMPSQTERNVEGTNTVHPSHKQKIKPFHWINHFPIVGQISFSGEREGNKVQNKFPWPTVHDGVAGLENQPSLAGANINLSNWILNSNGTKLLHVADLIFPNAFTFLGRAGTEGVYRNNGRNSIWVYQNGTTPEREDWYGMETNQFY